MIQYLKADLWRINRRVPRWILFIAYLLLGIIITVATSNQKSFNFIKLGEGITMMIRFMTVILAMCNLYFVFEDDMQVKTAQTAIGRGLNRSHIILEKWIQMMLLSLLDGVALLLVTYLTGLIRGVALKGAAAAKVTAQLCGTWLTIGVMTALVMIIIFYIMHIGVTQILFIILCFKPISMVLNFQEMSNEILAKLRLSRFLIGSNLDGFQQSLEVGKFNLQNFIVILIYWIIGMGITYMIFRKKELDF